MSFFSTRGGACATTSQAILWGLAKDGGLFVPSMFPKIPLDRLALLEGKSYQEQAARVLRDYMEDYSIAEIEEAVNAAYSADAWDAAEIEEAVNAAYTADAWDAPEIAPVHTLSEDTYVLELFHGPTLAFKDIALKLLPHTIRQAAKKNDENREVSILVATSGDTGKAALEGYCDIDRVKIKVFYPVNGVSNIQKKQMSSQKGNNVDVVSINGNFDDAQTGVKKIFTDNAVKAKLFDNNMVHQKLNL